MAEIAEDEYTGNTDIGQAAQTGILDFWAIATAQSVYWPKPYTASNLHAEESMLIQIGALANGYVENSSLAAALIGLKFEFATPAVLTFDVYAGSKIEISILDAEMSTNRVVLSGNKIKINEALEARAIQSKIKASVSEMEAAVDNLKSGALSAAVAEKIRI